MAPEHKHYKADDTVADKKDDTVATIPTSVNVPSIWVARIVYAIIILFLGYLSRMSNTLEQNQSILHKELQQLSLVVHDLPSREYVEKITASLDQRLQVLELWQSNLNGNILTTQDKFDITKEITNIRISLTEAINEVDRKVDALPNNSPPEWYQNQTNEKFKSIEERLKSIEIILYRGSKTYDGVNTPTTKDKVSKI